MTSKGRILIVEDDLSMITMLQYMLEDEGYETRNAIGEKALALAEEFQPNLILLDIMMPLMDGEQWSIRAKANPKLKEIPIIVLSAASPEVVTYHYKHLQATTFLAKPFELDHLIDLVNSFKNNPDDVIQAKRS